MPATLQAVEEFIAEFCRQLQAHLGQSQSFDAQLLAREALINAVVHGCGSDAGGQVRCRVRLKGGCLTILVADSGKGFDWRAARAREAGLAEASGRGIEILRKYATRVRYNDKGNAVTISKTLLVRE